MSFTTRSDNNSSDRFFRIYYKFVIDENRAITAHSHSQGLFFRVNDFRSSGT